MPKSSKYRPPETFISAAGDASTRLLGEQDRIAKALRRAIPGRERGALDGRGHAVGLGLSRKGAGDRDLRDRARGRDHELHVRAALRALVASLGLRRDRGHDLLEVVARQLYLVELRLNRLLVLNAGLLEERVEVLILLALGSRATAGALGLARVGLLLDRGRLLGRVELRLAALARGGLLRGGLRRCDGHGLRRRCLDRRGCDLVACTRRGRACRCATDRRGFRRELCLVLRLELGGRLVELLHLVGRDRVRRGCRSRRRLGDGRQRVILVLRHREQRHAGRGREAHADEREVASLVRLLRRRRLGRRDRGLALDVARGASVGDIRRRDSLRLLLRGARGILLRLRELLLARQLVDRRQRHHVRGLRQKEIFPARARRREDVVVLDRRVLSGDPFARDSLLRRLGEFANVVQSAVLFSLHRRCTAGG